jgi:protein O-GlcNAc transferase
LNQLLEADTASKVAPPMQRRMSEAIQVRASAVAALTANVLAAKDMASAAHETLSSMGLDVSTISAPSIPAQATSAALQRLPSSSAATPLGEPSASQVLHAGTDPSGSKAGVIRLVEQVERENGCTPEARNTLLAYAHTMYSSDADMDLLPLLHMLDRVHPGHCPTLLLLSCVYYTRGIKSPPGSLLHRHNLEASIVMNQRILEIDPEYVEAMSNIGTTLRALGKLPEAERFWKRAINIRPTYFDSVENLRACRDNVSSRLKP